MAKIYESLKNLITPGMVSKAASALGEDSSKVSSASSAMLATLLAKLLQEGNTSTINGIIQDAGKANIMDRTDEVFSGSCVINGVNYGERLENALIGKNNLTYPKAIAAKTGISTTSAGKLSHWVSSLIAGYLGNKVVNGNESLTGILSDLSSEKNAIKNDIPSNVMSGLGLTSCMNASKTVNADANSYVAKDVDKKKGNGWIIWLILALLLLLLLFFWMRSCNRRGDDRVAATTNTERIEEQRRRTRDSLDRVNRAAENNKASNQLVAMTLPNGEQIYVRKGGCEDRMISYLKSNDFKNASADDLKNRWFEFDDIEFVHNSATELMDGSERQLKNLISILDDYDNVRIVIGGFADKTGSDDVNNQISKRRADYIKSEFVKSGVPASRIRTQGFGERYAEHAASAPDNVRAEDRDIALRFEK